MNTIFYRSSKVFGLTCFLFLFINPLFGQRTQLFSGERSFGNYQGNANYEYVVEGIDTIFNGSFQFQKSNLEALLKDNDSTFFVSGSFDFGVPQGDWKFQFGSYQSDSLAQVTGFQYQVNVNGIFEETTGVLQDGKPQGRWIVSSKNIKNSQVLDSLFFSEINFSNGIAQQSFTISDQKASLIGRFLRDGLAHDSWSLYSDEGSNTENWIFNSGWLEQIEIYQNGIPQIISLFNPNNEISRVVDLDEGFSKLVGIYAAQASDARIDFSKGISSVLSQNSSRYKKIEHLLQEFGSKERLNGFKVKVPYYPKDSTLLKDWDTTLALALSASSTTSALLENTRLNLIKRSDEEANDAYKILVQLDQFFAQPLAELVSLEQLNISTYLQEKMLADHLFPNGLPSPEITYTDQNGTSKTYLGPGGNEVNFNQNGIQGYLAIAKYLSQSLEEINTTLGQKLEDDKQQQEFTLLEEQMIAQANALIAIPDSIIQDLGKSELKALESIKVTTEMALKEYAEMPSNDEKLNQARFLISCLLDYDALSKEIIQLPKRAMDLQVLYTDAVFNPFTATIMDESVKKRLMNAYNTVVIPYLLEKVEQSLHCTNASAIQQLLNDSFERMIVLRDEDTAKMERKLRKERNPKVVLQLFNLKPLEE